MASSSTPSTPPPSAPPAKKSRTGLYAIVAVIVIIIIAVVALYATGYLSPTPPTANITANDDGSCSPRFDSKCNFSPTSYSTTVGKAVVWKGGGTLQHSVTASGNSTASWSNASSNDQNLNSGSTVSVTFNQAGNYAFYCKYHDWMKGNVTVTA